MGGAIPKQYIPAVEKGVIEAMGQGGVFGYPGGRRASRPATTGNTTASTLSEMSFKMAGSLAFREAMAKANRCCSSPQPHRGDRACRHAGRRPRRPQLATRPGAGNRHLGRRLQLITAIVPTAEIQRYAIDLRSLTAGRGRFHAEHDHYDVVPANLADKLAKSKSD